MRKKKLTVSVPQDLLGNFRRYAELNDTTMTSLVENFLRRLLRHEIPTDAPITRRLSGMLSQGVKVQDHKKNLVEKYTS